MTLCSGNVHDFHDQQPVPADAWQLPAPMDAAVRRVRLNMPALVPQRHCG
jgi:hypothetical protein